MLHKLCMSFLIETYRLIFFSFLHFGPHFLPFLMYLVVFLFSYSHSKDGEIIQYILIPIYIYI